MIYEFQATQDLHGWEKPWAPGAGPNKCDEIWEIGGISGSTGENVVQTNTIRTVNYQPVTGGASYYVSTPVGTSAYLFYYDDSKTYLSNSGGYVVGSVTVPEGVSFVRMQMSNTYGTTYKNNIALNSPSTVTSYSPYSNICMPEGFNIWNPTNAEYVQVYAGYVNSNTRELYLRPVYEEYAGEELVGPWMSSLDEYSEDATPTEGAFVIDFGGELTSYEITPFMLQTLLDSLGIRQHFTDGAGLLNKLMDQAQGRVRSEEELLHLSRPLKVIAIGDQLPAGLTFKPISKDVLPGLPGKFIR